MHDFTSFGLSEPLLRAIASEGYRTPTPVQMEAIPPLLEGRDVLGIAQTGTGKTAAFALPVLQAKCRDSRRGQRRVLRTLVLTPTRELAAQIDERFGAYGAFIDVQHRVIFGGVSQVPQVRALQRGLDILVATPGRLLDLVGQGHVDLSQIEFFVLDEADRMLDMGFINDIKKVLKLLPSRRQNLLFSATMPKSIATLAGSFLRDAVRIEVTPEEMTVEAVEQRVMYVDKANKRHLLAALIKQHRVNRGIVFTRTKHGANRLVKQLAQADIDSIAIHGNKSQGARTRALAGFKNGSVPILVATDIASRGIDVEGVTHVFNFDLPNEPESYVHRIGRTARAGKSGVALAFCDDTEGGYLKDIERLTGTPIEVDLEHAFHSVEAMTSTKKPPAPGSAHRQRGRRGGSPSRGGNGYRRNSDSRRNSGAGGDKGSGSSQQRGGRSRGNRQRSDRGRRGYHGGRNSN